MDFERESLLIVLAVAALAPLIADLPRRVKTPVVVVELLLGIAIGPEVLDWAQPDALLDALATFGVAFLFFLAGMEIEFERIGGPPANLAVRGWFVSLGLGVAAGLALWGLELASAPMIVALALCTTSLGVLVPVLGDAGVLKKPFGSFALAAGSAGELGPIVAISVVLALDSGEPWRVTLLLVFAAVAVGVAALTLRARPARVVRVMHATMETSGQFAIRLSVLVVAGLFVLAGELGLDVVLGAFTAGMIVGLVARGPEAEDYRAKLAAIGYGFLIPVFFISTGMGFDLDKLLDDPAAIALVPLFALLFLAARGLPALLLYRGALPPSERVPLAFMSAAALPLVVAITEIGTETGRLHEEDAVALVGAGMLSLLAYPLIGLALLRRAGRTGAG